MLLDEIPTRGIYFQTKLDVVETGKPVIVRESFGNKKEVRRSNRKFTVRQVDLFLFMFNVMKEERG